MQWHSGFALGDLTLITCVLEYNDAQMSEGLYCVLYPHYRAVGSLKNADKILYKRATESSPVEVVVIVLEGAVVFSMLPLADMKESEQYKCELWVKQFWTYSVLMACNPV
jgi:hypothetical protein